MKINLNKIIDLLPSTRFNSSLIKPQSAESLRGGGLENLLLTVTRPPVLTLVAPGRLGMGYCQLLYLLLVSPTACLSAQECNLQIQHTSGTQQFGCTSVTVTAQGSVETGSTCGYGPYWIGHFGTSSYIYSFSNPVNQAVINVTALNRNDPFQGADEEMAVFVNGVFYPFTQPGQYDNCYLAAEISPTGTIVACNPCVSSWKNIVVTGSITTLEIQCVQISGAPNGIIYSLNICCCQTNAGVLNSNPLNLCPGSIANVAPATQTVLDNTDILRYILFSNPADTLGSIIKTNTTPSFTFNPNLMQLGTTYYIAAIAGNNSNGNVNLADPCLDVSNAIPVTWHPLPAVTFSVADPTVCNGACTDITATFAGTPPFNLSYSTTFSSFTTQMFSGNNGTFQVCVPGGAPAGNMLIQAIELTDSFCTCN